MGNPKTPVFWLSCVGIHQAGRECSLPTMNPASFGEAGPCKYWETVLSDQFTATADEPVSPVRMRMASSTVEMNTLPSPILPVLALLTMASATEPA